MNLREGGAIEFLRALFGRAPGGARVSLWCRRSKLTFHQPAEDLAFAVERATGLASSDDVYVGACARRPGLEPSERGKNADCVYAAAAWLDVDFAGPGHAARDLPPPDFARALPESAGLPPASIVVATGGGYHFWWLLSRDVNLSVPAEREAHSRLVRNLQARVRSHAQLFGYRVDSTHDLSRVLRVPGTWNRKGPVAVPVTLDSLTACCYDPDILVPPSGSRTRSAVLAPGSVARGAGPGSADHPGVRDPLGGATQVPAATPAALELRRRLQGLKSPATREFLRAILDARPAAPGARDEVCWGAARCCALVGADLGAEALLEVLRPWLAATAAASPEDDSNPPPDEGVLAEKLHRALEQVAEEREARKRETEAFARVLGGPNPPPGEPGPGDPYPSAPAAVPDGAAPRGKYTEAELIEHARLQGCRIEELHQRYVVQRGGAYYILEDGKYAPPVSHVDLEVAMRDRLVRAPVEFWRETASGTGFVRRKLPEILLECSTTADGIISDLSAPYTRFEAATATIIEAPCPPRIIQPLPDDRVHRWLEILGGQVADKLLDWIATIGRLDRPTCILYLEGAPSAGKNMLVGGLSRLWTKSGSATQLESIVGNFNDDLVRCPLVFADEQLPHIRGISAFLRALVGGGARQLRRKYMPNATILGCPRVVLAANDDKMLDAVADDDLSQYASEAVAQRFLHVKVSHDAVKYLESLGGRGNNGRPGTKDWIDGDVIAAHAVYLAKTRQVYPGSRFLVEGEATAMHRQLTRKSKIAQLVSEWLARHLTSPTPTPNVTDLIRVGGGDLLVNVDAIYRGWDFYIKSDDVPSTGRIGRVLSSWSTGEVEVGGRRFYRIPPDVVLDFVDKSQIGSRATLEDAIQYGRHGALQ